MPPIDVLPFVCCELRLNDRENHLGPVRVSRNTGLPPKSGVVLPRGRRRERLSGMKVLDLFIAFTFSTCERKE